MRWCVVLCLLLWAAQATAATGAAAWRSVWVAADKLPPLVGHAITDLSVASYRDGHFQPIPFQIDEVNQLGLVAFSAGLSPLDGKAGVFDGHDQLGFMWRDAGALAPATAQPADGTLLAALRVRLPGDTHDARYVYLISGSKARSQHRYVNQSLSSGVTSTPVYRLAVNPDNELDWRDFRYQGYQGAGSIIDSLRMRMTAHMFSRYTPGVTLDNDNLKPMLLASKRGPIRSVMLMKINVVLLGIPVMTLYEQVSRYPSRYQAVSYTQVPSLYRATLKDPRVAVSIVGNALLGSEVTTALGGKPAVQVDGHMSRHEKQLRSSGIDNRHNWIYFNSRQNFVMVTHLNIPESLRTIPVSLVYADDKGGNAGDALLPNVGYAINAWPKQKVMQFGLDLLFDNSLHGDTPAAYLKTRVAPAQIQVILTP